MSIYNLTEREKQMRKQTEDVRRVLQQQIAGAIDTRRSKDYWQNILSDFSIEAIAEALSSELNHFNYCEVTHRHCCCRSR